VDIFFQANGIAEEKQVGIFLSLLEVKTYSLLRDLVAPAKPKEKSLAQLTKILQTHFELKPLKIAERFNFYRWNQLANESIAAYMAKLCKLATHCQFGEFLDEALCDHLVSGLHAPSIQKRLLTEEDLSCNDAMKLAKSIESAQMSSSQLQGNDTSSGSSGVNYASRFQGRATSQSSGKKSSSRGKSCHCCGVNIFPALADLRKLCVISARRKAIWQEYAGLVPGTRLSGRPLGGSSRLVSTLKTISSRPGLI